VTYNSHKQNNGTFWNFPELNLLTFVDILATEKVPKSFHKNKIYFEKKFIVTNFSKLFQVCDANFFYGLTKELANSRFLQFQKYFYFQKKDKNKCPKIDFFEMMLEKRKICNYIINCQNYLKRIFNLYKQHVWKIMAVT
jgi:hypothetical protein